MTQNIPSKTRDGFSLRDRFFVLLGLTGFCIAAPVLSIFGKNSGLFLFHHVDTLTKLSLYALVVAFAPALLLLLFSAIVQWVNRQLLPPAHLLIVGILAQLWAVQTARWRLDINHTEVLLLVAIVSAILFVWAYSQLHLFRAWLRATALAPFIIVAVFYLDLDRDQFFNESETHKAANLARRDMPSVLFILLDEIPTVALFDGKGAIDNLRYPSLAELADQSTWYTHYTVLTSQTRNSVPAILAGSDPLNASPVQANYPQNLFTMLEPTHRLIAFETATKLCASSNCNSVHTEANAGRAQYVPLLAKTASLWLRRVSFTTRATVQMDDYQEVLTNTAEQPAKPPAQAFRDLLDPARQVDLARARPRRLENFMEFIAPQQTPALYFLHLQMPHSPWRFYADGQLYSVPHTRSTISPHNRIDWLTKLAEYRFALQAQYTDSLLGDIFAKLKQLNLWDEMLVVVTADHGRSFVPNSDTRSLREGISDVAYVPLFIKKPLQRSGRIDESNVMAYDILPSIAHVLNLDLAWEMPGYPVGDEKIAHRRDRKIVFPLGNVNRIPVAIAEREFFSDTTHFPDYSSRWIPTATSTAGNLDLLNSGLALDEYIGRSSTEFEVQPGGEVIIEEIGQLRTPTRERPPLAIVMGNLVEDTMDGTVLVAVNGRFVTGSPIFEFQEVSNTFVAMLPQGVLKSQNDIGLFLLKGGRLRALVPQ